MCCGRYVSSGIAKGAFYQQRSNRGLADQIKCDLQFDPQIKLKAFHQHICGSDQLTDTLTRDQENTDSDWLGKMTSFFIQSESTVGKHKLHQIQ